MKQSSAIFGSIVIAYLVYITQSGKLSLYLQLLRGNKTAKASPPQTDKTSNPIKDIIDSVTGDTPKTTPQTNTPSQSSGGFDFFGEVNKVLSGNGSQTVTPSADSFPDMRVGETIDGYNKRVDDWKAGR